MKIIDIEFESSSLESQLPLDIHIVGFPLRNFLLKLNCVVSENIHTPTTEGIGNSRVVGLEALGNSKADCSVYPD